MKKNDLRDKIHLTSVDELFGLENAESSIEIAIDRIRSFKDHPFKVLDDDKMADLVESIKANGVLTPVLVRGNDGDGYEMISGHRRLHASRLAGLKKIPAFVRELSDDEATIVMVDSNIQREELLPSEKAFAYKMKLEAMKRKAGRPSKDNSVPVAQKLGTTSREELGKQVGESQDNVRRYIRLTELIPDIMCMVDEKKIALRPAVEISYLPEERQLTNKDHIMDNLCSLLGGRAAEEVFLKQTSTGALNDLERATKQAYAMVAYYGMSDKLKNLSYYDSTGRYDMGITKPYSEKTAEIIDTETSAIIAEQMARAKKILEENAEGHNKLADLLIEKEVITSDDVEAILGARPWTSRTDEIIEANEAMQATEIEKPKKKRASRKKKEEEVVVSQEPRTESQDETQEALWEENKN